MNTTRLLSLTAIAALSFSHPAPAAESTHAFSDPSRPGQLTVHLAQGEVRVIGADVDVVTVRTDAEAAKHQETRADGLRVISSSSSYQLDERDNRMTLAHGLNDWGQPADFTITVPRQTALDIKVNFGGEISVSDVDGNVTIQGLNGGISLHDLGGGAIVEAMNGEIHASFTKLSPENPISFTSMNGEITVRLPVDASANVRFRSQNGSILTDFDDTQLVTTTTSGPAFAPGMREEIAQTAREMAAQAAEIAREVAAEVRMVMKEARQEKPDGNSDVEATAPRAPQAPRAPRPPSIPSVSGGKVISGTLNDAGGDGAGNTDLQIATMNGDIIVRKRD